MSRDDNWDQPPGVDIHDDAKRLPDPISAAVRIGAFLEWFGDGDIAGDFPSGPPLYARDLEAVARLALAHKDEGEK